jgi:hypothetical protein
MNMNTFPWPSHKNWRARGKELRGGGVGWLKILECETASLGGPPDRILYLAKGRATRRAIIVKACDLLRRLIKVSATELAEESPCARMRIIPRREDWRPRALLKGSNGILRAPSASSYEQA